MTFCDNASVCQLVNDCIFSPSKYHSFSTVTHHDKQSTSFYHSFRINRFLRRRLPRLNHGFTENSPVYRLVSVKTLKLIKNNENNPFFGFFLPQTIIILFSDYLLNRKWIVKIYSNKANIQSDAIVTQFTRHFLIQFESNLNDILESFEGRFFESKK